MLQINYYIKKIQNRLSNIFSIKRIKKYGLKIAILDFLIFLNRRNNSRFEHWLIRQKDLIVQKYIYKNYKSIISKIIQQCD